jgi:hypothetical protein
MPSYDNINKPTTSFSDINKPALFGFLLLENGGYVLTEGYGKYEINDEDYDRIDESDSPTYTNIN